MNTGRISRHYRRRRGVDIAKNICLRCFQFGHRKGPHCKNDPLVTCGICYRSYIFTTDCNHSNSEVLTLRLVEGEKYAKPVIDIVIGTNIYEAYINLSIENTRINLDVLDHINECKELLQLPKVTLPGLISFTVRRRFRQALLQLEVKIAQTEPVVLGMDFFMETGFELTADRVSINERSPILSSTKTIDYLYNLPQGSHLRGWLNEKNRPMCNGYIKGDQPELQEPQVQINPQPVDDTDVTEDNDVLELHASFEDRNVH